MDLGLSTPTDSAPSPALEIQALESSLRSGANWFYWIAALSLVNSVIQLFGSDWNFVVGLGVTQIVDAIATAFTAEASSTVSAVVKGFAFGVDVVIAGVFALFAWLGGRRHGWALVVGMVLYALDGVIFIFAQAWMSVAFHAFALYAIFQGLVNLRRLREREEQLGLRPIGPATSR
jgi:hypothetical protein